MTIGGEYGPAFFLFSFIGMHKRWPALVVDADVLAFRWWCHLERGFGMCFFLLKCPGANNLVHIFSAYCQQTKHHFGVSGIIRLVVTT